MEEEEREGEEFLYSDWLTRKEARGVSGGLRGVLGGKWVCKMGGERGMRENVRFRIW